MNECLVENLEAFECRKYMQKSVVVKTTLASSEKVPPTKCRQQIVPFLMYIIARARAAMRKAITLVIVSAVPSLCFLLNSSDTFRFRLFSPIRNKLDSTQFNLTCPCFS